MDLDTLLFPPAFARPACLIGDNGTNKPETLRVLRKSEQECVYEKKQRRRKNGHKVVEQVQLNRQHEHTDQNQNGMKTWMLKDNKL